MLSKLMLLAGLVITTQWGCITEGEPFPSDLSWIQMGKTTRSDVRRVLGKPRAVGNSSGSQTWTYGYYDYELFGKKRFKELKLYWGKDGSVKNFNFNSSFEADLNKNR